MILLITSEASIHQGALTKLGISPDIQEHGNIIDDQNVFIKMYLTKNSPVTQEDGDIIDEVKNIEQTCLDNIIVTGFWKLSILTQESGHLH